jgi:hypothetical protein
MDDDLPITNRILGIDLDDSRPVTCRVAWDWQISNPQPPDP